MEFPWIEFFTIVGAFGIGAISPGPDFAMVLRQSIAYGRGAAIFTSAGIALAILVHGTYTLLGLGLIISQSIIVFSALKYVGAAYLIWLGYKAISAPPPIAPTDLDQLKDQEMGARQAFGIGFLTNLLNPKAALFFLALFSTLVSAETALIFKASYFVAMAVLLFIWFALVSLFFTTPKVRKIFYRMGVWFNRATGVALILLALKLAVAQKE
ncbi:MAG: LysE family transporter [Devosiaceae bacterium]|nr:LysE family transporter [Devosiaceae bacterium]